MAKAKRNRGNGINPLPSLIRASAFDAANMQMRAAGRVKWSNKDWNRMCEVQERLIRSCYGSDADHNETNRCYIRFQIAEQLEKRGDFNLDSDVDAVHAFIAGIVDAPMAEAA